jgi:hypothetical protein
MAAIFRLGLEATSLVLGVTTEVYSEVTQHKLELLQDDINAINKQLATMNMSLQDAYVLFLFFFYFLSFRFSSKTLMFVLA